MLESSLILSIIVFSIIVLCVLSAIWLFNYSEKRLILRAQTWLCPNCNIPFGHQNEYITWDARQDPLVNKFQFRPPCGILLLCNKCKKEFRFTNKGKMFPEIQK